MLSYISIYILIIIYVILCYVYYYYHILIKIIFSQQIFEKKRNIYILNFRKILPVEDELFHVDGQTIRQTDRRDEANSLFFL